MPRGKYPRKPKLVHALVIPTDFSEGVQVGGPIEPAPARACARVDKGDIAIKTVDGQWVRGVCAHLMATVNGAEVYCKRARGHEGDHNSEFLEFGYPPDGECDAPVRACARCVAFEADDVDGPGYGWCRLNPQAVRQSVTGWCMQWKAKP